MVRKQPAAHHPPATEGSGMRPPPPCHHMDQDRALPPPCRRMEKGVGTMKEGGKGGGSGGYMRLEGGGSGDWRREGRGKQMLPAGGRREGGQ